MEGLVDPTRVGCLVDLVRHVEGLVDPIHVEGLADLVRYVEGLADPTHVEGLVDLTYVGGLVDPVRYAGGVHVPAGLVRVSTYVLSSHVGRLVDPTVVFRWGSC